MIRDIWLADQDKSFIVGASLLGCSCTRILATSNNNISSIETKTKQAYVYLVASSPLSLLKRFTQATYAISSCAHAAMTDPPPRPPILNNYAALVSTLSSFLTVSIHTLLYERALYPANSFISARAYRFPVRQSRHPKVCEWINDAVSAVEKEIAAGRVERVSFVVYDIGGKHEDSRDSNGAKDAKVVERWVFDIGSWPIVSSDDRLVEFDDDDGKGKESEPEKAGVQEASEEAKAKIRMVDIEEQLRGTIRKLGHTAEKMPKLPEECTYTLVVELRDEAEPPLGHPQPWIPSEPSLQATKDKDTGNTKRGAAVGGAKSIPVRVVESGAFVLETWVEQAK